MNPAVSAAQAAVAAEPRLRAAIDDLANQLCVAVDGDFDFAVRSAVDDETLEKLTMLINFVVDTARRGMSALREHNRALSEIDRAKTVFFSNASHELRTPLTLILGPIEDALSRPDGALHGDALATAHRNVLRLLKLVNALLDFTRIEAGRVRATCAPTDLGALTTELAGVFRAAIERAGLRLTVDCEPNLPPIWVDRAMWENIVLNLVSNALKFTFDGGITVSLRLQEPGVALEVRDTGVGIPADELPHIFERFRRVEGARSRTHEGFGIGLAMIHELVRIHGGAIDVSSTVDRGTAFVVSIPAGCAHLPAERIAVEDSAPATGGVRRAFFDEAVSWTTPAPAPHGVTGSAPASADGSTRRHARVLLAEDNADMRAYVERLLSPHWEVQSVADGEAALQAAREHPPDLLLCDVMMPRADGHQVVHGLRADPRTQSIPVILLSARAGEEAVVEALEGGADDYLVKPFSSRELVARVRTHLELSRLRNEAAVRAAHLYEREQTARAAAESANRTKDEFLAMLGHELRNPLAPIVTALQIMELRGEKTTQSARAVIQRQVNHLVRLVDDLLDVSRITRAKIELKTEVVELSKVVAKAIETASPILEQRRHQLTVSVPRAGLRVNADPMRLGQVVSNLLTNAAKYTEPGGRVAIAARREDDRIVLRVRDDGIGIDADLLPRVFDLFMQAPQSLARSEGGLGLGLTIVRSLTILHGGTVEAHSDGAGCGSEFVIRLPVAVVTKTAATDEDSRRPEADPGRPSRRILIVDDNVDAAEMLEFALQHAGHTMRVVHDGPAALAAIAGFRPDIALLDIGLPVMDGYELAERLREQPALAGMRLVAVSGYGQEADRDRSRAVGFDAHLVKPVDVEELVALVDRLVAT